MTARGGAVPPDGRQRPPAGPGSLSNRQDMSQPVRVPNMHGSDLQYGEKQMLAGAQKVQPLGRQVQPAARPRPAGGGRSGGQPPAAPGSGIPGEPTDPIQFLSRRLRGTMDPRQRPQAPMRTFDGSRWLPLLRALASDPGSGGLLQAAYIEALSRAVNTPAVPGVSVVDFNQLDRDIGTFLEEG